MQTMLIKERYKVIRALDVREEYAFLEAVDIKEREKCTCFVNLYEGSLLPTYLDVYERLEVCPEFDSAFIAEGSLAAVFAFCQGSTIDEVFYRGARLDWETRLEFAELLLHKALTMANFPPEVSCAAMLSENLVVDIPGHRLMIRWKVSPMEGMNARELVYLTADQLQKILLKRFESPTAELEFLQRLEDGACHSVVQLYSLWRESKDAIRDAYTAQQQANFIKRWFSQLRKTIQWKWKHRRTEG